MRSGIARIISHRWSRKSWISLFLSTVDRNRSNLSRFRADQIVHTAVLRVHRLVAATSAAVVYPRRQAEEERSPVIWDGCILFFCFFFLHENVICCKRAARRIWPSGPREDIYSRTATDGENSHPFSDSSVRLGSARLLWVEVSMEARLARQWPCFPMTENEDTPPPRHWVTTVILEALLKDAL